MEFDGYQQLELLALWEEIEFEKVSGRDLQGVSVGNLLRRVGAWIEKLAQGGTRGRPVPGGSPASGGPAGTSRINHS